MEKKHKQGSEKTKIQHNNAPVIRRREKKKEGRRRSKRWSGCVSSCPGLWQCAVDSQLGPLPRFLSTLTGKTEHTWHKYAPQGRKVCVCVCVSVCVCVCMCVRVTPGWASGRKRHRGVSLEWKRARSYKPLTYSRVVLVRLELHLLHVWLL